MTAPTSLSGRRGLGGLAGVAGGGLMVAAVFLPWLSRPAAEGAVSGWDTYRQASGVKQWYIQEAFADGFSPFFSGLSVLIAGALLALVGLAMLASLRGGAFRLPLAGVIVLGLLALLIFLLGITNLLSVYATGDPGEMTPAYGLYLLTAGATVGMLGVWLGIGRGRN